MSLSLVSRPTWNHFMEALFTSTFAVAIAEIGDKTQLLSLLLVAKFHKRLPILLGILIATIVNHGLSAWFGNWLGSSIETNLMHWIISVSFLLMAIWVLIPDKDDDTPSRWHRYGPFIASLVLFFLAEIGDKTQVATVILAANYPSIIMVTLGTTLGMLLANVPVVLAGQWIMDRMPMALARKLAFALFVALAVLNLLNLT